MTCKLPLPCFPVTGFLFLLAAVFSLAAPLQAGPEDYADYVRPTDRTSLLSADPRDVAIMGGGIAVIAAKESLEVTLDESTGPMVVGAIPLNALSVAPLGGTCVAVGTKTGVSLVDVTDPANPQVTQTITLTFTPQVVHVAASPKPGGGFVVHAVVESTYAAFDVTGCQSSSFLRVVQLPDVANGVDGTDSIAVVGTESCMVVIDSTTEPPTILGTTPGQFGDVAFSPASLSRVFTTRSSLFTVVDISDPSAPVVIFESDPFPAFRIVPCDPGTSMAGQKGSFPTLSTGPANCLDLVAVSEDAFGVRTYDVSDPSNPFLVGAVQLPGMIAGLDWRGDEIGAVGAEPLGFQILQATNAASPPKLGLVPNLSSSVAGHVDKERELLYIIDGLPTKVYDIANPLAPAPLSMMNTGGIDVYALGDHAYIVDGSQMQVWDMSDPSNPTMASSLAGSYLSLGADASQSNLLSAARFAPGNAIDIIDVSNPAVPLVRGSVGLPEPGFSIEVIESTTVVALGASGFGIVDFSDPDNPIFELLPTLDPAKSVSYASSPDRILVGSDRGVALYDSQGTLLGDLEIPTLREDNDLRLARFGGDGAFPVSQVDSTRKVAYALSIQGTMYVVDITDAQSMFVIGEYTEPGLMPLFIEPSSSALYLGDGSLSGQTLILPPQLVTPPTTDVPGPEWRPGDFVLRAPEPNPFTASARVRFVLGEPATVDLAVYDVAGRRQRRLAEGPHDAGEFVLSWDGRNKAGRVVAPGVYFLRLAVDSQVAVRRVVRLP